MEGEILAIVLDGKPIAGIFNLNKFCIAFANLNQLDTLY